jgi:hypothetical protein
LLLAAVAVAAFTVPLVAEAATSARAGFRSARMATPVSSVTGTAVHRVLAGAGLVANRPPGTPWPAADVATLLVLVAPMLAVVRRRRRIGGTIAFAAGTGARGPPLAH